MAQNTGTVLTHTDTLTQRRAVSDVITFISPKETPFLQFFGLNNNDKFRLANFPNMIFRWFEDELRAIQSGLAATIASDATTFAVTAGEGDFFRIGDILIVDAEHMYVSSIATDTLTITRAYAGTTSASHASGTTNLDRLSIARAEEGSFDASSQVVRTAVTQYGQIFEDVVEVTYEDENLAEQYGGIGSELDYQVNKRMPELMRMVERAVFRGRSSSATGTSYAFAGLGQLITNNTSGATGTALTQKAFDDAVESAWVDGGNPDVVFCNSWGLRKLSAMHEGRIRTVPSDRMGGYYIRQITTQFGDLDVVVSRWCEDDRMYILDSQYVGNVEITSFFEEPVPSTKTTHRRRVYGTISFVAKHDKAHAFIDFSSTA